MKKELVINFIFTMTTSIILFLQNKYFIRYMGLEILGIMKLFTQLLQYLNIIELGLGSASTFALYKPLAEKNIEQVSIIVSTIKRIYNKIALLLLLLGILATPLLPYFIELENFDKRIYFYWIFYVLNTVSTYLYIKYVILFTANQEFIKVRFIQSSSKIFYQIMQIICIIKYSSFFIFILLLLLDNITQYVLFKIRYKKYYSYIYSTEEKYSGLNRDIKNLFWHKLGTLVVFNTDLILISKLVSIEIVGIYASYQMIVQILLMIMGVIINVIRPKIGKFVSMNTKEEIYRVFKKINIIFLGVAIFLSYVSYIVVDDFIKLWLGNDIILGKTTLILIFINTAIQIFRDIVEIFKESSGFFEDIQSPILESIINFVFSIILGIKYGLNGIIIGTLISNIIIILIYKPILMFKRCFKKNIKEYIKVYLNYLAITVLSILVLEKIKVYFVADKIFTWFMWVKYSTLVSIITGIVIVISLMLNGDFRIIIGFYILKNRR